MRALVTVGAGFLGSTLVDMLLDFGHDVQVIDDYTTGSALNLVRAHQRGVRTEVGSVAARTVVDPVMRGFKPEVVFHLAAQVDVRRSAADPLGDARANVMGTVNMLRASAAAGVSRFVFVSSAAVFGDPADAAGRVSAPRLPLAPVRPISPYGAGKAAAEVYVDLYGLLHARGESAMSTCTVVLSNVYGPRQRAGAGAVNIFARALLADEPVTLYGDGGNVRDYVFGIDAVRALAWSGGCLRSGGSSVPAGRILIGTGVGTTDRDLLDLVGTEVARQTGRKVTDMAGTLEALTNFAPARSVDIRRMVFPAGHGMTPTTLADGIAVTVQAIRKDLGL